MRRFYRLTKPDNAGEWLLPTLEPVEQATVPIRNTLVHASGADGAFDVYADQRAPLDSGSVSLSFIIDGDTGAGLETAIAAMESGLGYADRATGRRKLWSCEADGTLPRWAFCKLAERPTMAKQRANILHQQVSVDLLLPDPLFYDPITAAWLAANGYTSQAVSSAIAGEPIAPDLDFARFDITTSPFAFTLKNAGPLETRRVLFRLESQAAGGFTNPQISNATTVQSFSSTTDGATSSTVLSINAQAGLGRARVSANGGSSWVDDSLNLLLGQSQAVLMELAPGDNVFSITNGGTPNLRLLCWWAHGWRN